MSSIPSSASPCKRSASDAIGAWPTLFASSSLNPLCTASGYQVRPSWTARFSRRWYASSPEIPAWRVKRELTCTGAKTLTSVRPDSVKGRFSTTCTRCTSPAAGSASANAARGRRAKIKAAAVLVIKTSEKRRGAEAEHGEEAQVVIGRARSRLGQVGSPDDSRGMEERAQLGAEADPARQIEAHPGADLAERPGCRLGRERAARSRTGRGAEVERIVPEHPDARARERVRLEMDGHLAEEVELPVDGRDPPHRQDGSPHLVRVPQIIAVVRRPGIRIGAGRKPAPDFVPETR